MIIDGTWKNGLMEGWRGKVRDRVRVSGKGLGLG